MSLTGTLDTLSVPELLTVLAATKRSGELVLRAESFEGRLWLSDGALVKADVPGISDLVEAVCALLGLVAGEFSFDTDAAVPPAGPAVPMEELLAEAESRRSEWPGLEAAVPSLAAHFRLGTEPTAGPVTLAAEQWQMLAVLTSGASVGAAMEGLGLGEVDARRAVKALRDAGLVEPASGPPPEPGAAVPPMALRQPAPAPATAGADDKGGGGEPAADQPGADEAGADDKGGAGEGGDEPGRAEAPQDPAAEDEPVSRSLLFRYLSGDSF